jgi:hypothetical protein
MPRGGNLEGTMSSKSRLEPARVGSGQLGKGIGIFISMFTIHVASQRHSQSVPSRLGSTRGDFIVPSKIPPQYKYFKVVAPEIQ